MKHVDESKLILELVGGPTNVRSLVHCATRLRFELVDEGVAQADRLEALPYVLKVIRSGGQYQVVIGAAVADYHAALNPLLATTPVGVASQPAGNPWKRAGNLVLKVISGSFSPLIPLMAGSGMIKALLALLVTLHWLAEDSSTYLVLNAAGNAVFYFLPALLGYTISKQLGASPFVGAGIGLALLDPSFLGLVGVEGTTFLGIGLQAVSYANTVFPVFIAIVIYSFLERGLNRVIIKDLQYFLTPMLCLLIMVPFTALLFGPFGNNVGDAVAAGVQWLFDLSGVLAGLVLGAVFPFLTILGLHWGFTPITLQNLNAFGGDIIEGVAVCAVYAQIGVALGCWLKARRGTQIREVAGPTALTGIFAGVTEPILYGLVMNYKRLMAVVAIAGGLGGAWNGAMHVTMDAYVFHNIFSILTLSYSPIVTFLVGIGISLIAGAAMTYFWGLRGEPDATVPLAEAREVSEAVKV